MKSLNATNRCQGNIAKTKVWVPSINIIHFYILLTRMMGKTVLRKMKIFVYITVHCPETFVLSALYFVIIYLVL